MFDSESKPTISINNKPRICFVGPMLGTNPGWVPNPMETLTPYLLERGYGCLLTSRKVNRYVRLTDIIRTLMRFRNAYDLVSVQAYSGPSFVVEEIVGFVSEVLQKPLMMVLHGGGMPEFMKRFPGWTKRVLGRADMIVTPSSYLSAAIRPYGFDARIIPNIIALERYAFKQRRKVKPRLLWMRTFYDCYNPQMAVYVLQKLLKEFPDAELTLAGQEKGLGDEIRALVSNLGLNAHVHFPGFISQEKKEECFSRHDIFLNTTNIDNMPVSLLEAGAFGLPIVSTDVGGVPYLVKHNESALLVKPNDVQGMVDTIKSLLSQPDLAARLSDGGRELAERSGPRSVIPAWEDAFEHLMAKQ